MNQKGQVLDYLITYGWLLIVIGIVFLGLIWVTNEPQPTEYWQEEWQCTKWQDTGKLINCKNNLIVTKECYPKKYEFEEPDGNHIIYNRICERETRENIICEHEKICIEQIKTRCLITLKACIEITPNFHNYEQAPEECWNNENHTHIFQKNKIIEIRECEQEEFE